MMIFRTLDGIEGLVPKGTPHPIVTDSEGRVNMALSHHVLTNVANNTWRSPLTTRTNVQRIVDVLAYLEDNDISLGATTVGNLASFRALKITKGLDGKPCSPRVADQSISAFKEYWKFGCANGYFFDSGLVGIADYKLSKSGYPDDNDIRLPTAEHIQDFSDRLRGPEERIGLSLGFGAGLRRAEIVALPADIILPIGEMERASSGAVLLTLDGVHAATKGGSRRVVEIPTLLYSQMYHYRVSERRDRRVARGNVQPASLLVSKYGNTYQPGWLNDAFRRAGRISGIAIYPHLMRHWYATRFIEYELKERFSGNELKAYRALKKLLGHRHIETTFRYTHIVNNEDARKVRVVVGFQRKLESMFEGARRAS